MPQLNDPHIRENRRLRPQANRVIGALGVAMGLVVLGFVYLMPTFQGGTRINWVETPGSVVHAEAVTEDVEEPWGNGTRIRTEHRAVLTVSYTFEGTERVQPVVSEGFRSEQDAAGYIAEAQAREPFVVYVNPDDPAQARLEPGTGARTWVISLGGVIVLVYGLVMLISNRTLQEHAGTE